MKKFILILFAAVSCFAARSQQATGFQKFAHDKDSMITAAYYKKDAAAASKYFDELMAVFNKLTDKERSAYKGTINGACYNVACAWALSGDKKKALDYLERSQYYDYDHLLADSDLASLSPEPRFIRYLAVAKRKTVSYLSTLQKAPKYNSKEINDLPAFTYQSESHSKLKALKERYNLDSVAGHGMDESRIINLMRWVHYLIPHDGSKGNPDVKNAMSLIKVCKRDKKTLNCRGLATVLNEVYLATGFKSRMVTCLPKDPNDNDCHVITMVYSEHLRKWLWMDPTFMAYVMNERGELLGIEEVRERLVHNRPLILNPDADRNHQTTQTKADYLENYMAKNLYILECPVTSQYDFETAEKGKVRQYIKLVPGGSVQEPYTSARKDGMNTLRVYSTANPTAFWAVPPGQARADFEEAMAQFMKSYNAGNDEKIRNSFSDSWGEFKSSVWKDGTSELLKERYGEVRSYKFLGPSKEDGVILYKVVCAKSTHAFGMTLDNNGKFKTFRFDTSSPEISKMLAKN